MSFSEILAAIQAWLMKPLFSIGDGSASLGNIVLALVFIGGIWWFAGALDLRQQPPEAAA